MVTVVTLTIPMMTISMHSKRHHKKDNNTSKMEETLEDLREAVKDFEYKGIYVSRKAILALMQGQSVESVELLLKNEGDFPKNYINRLVKKYTN